MLTPQAVILLESLLDLLEPAGRRLEAARVAPQLHAQVLGLEAHRPQALGECVELRVGARHGFREPLGLAECARDAFVPAALRRDRLRPASRGRSQPVELAQPAALGRQSPDFLDRGPERLDLVELEREQVPIAIARPRPGAERREL